MIKAKLFALTFPVQVGEKFFTFTVEDPQMPGGTSDYTAAIDGSYFFGMDKVSVSQLLDYVHGATKPVMVEFTTDPHTYGVVTRAQFST